MLAVAEELEAVLEEDVVVAGELVAGGDVLQRMGDVALAEVAVGVVGVVHVARIVRLEDDEARIAPARVAVAVEVVFDRPFHGLVEVDLDQPVEALVESPDYLALGYGVFSEDPDPLDGRLVDIGVDQKHGWAFSGVTF